MHLFALTGSIQSTKDAACRADKFMSSNGNRNKYNKPEMVSFELGKEIEKDVFRLVSVVQW